MRVVVSEGKCAGRVVELCGAASVNSIIRGLGRSGAGFRLGERAGHPQVALTVAISETWVYLILIR